MKVLSVIGLAITGVIGVAALMILFTLLGTFFGALTGWIVGWFFTDTILTGLAAFGVKGLTMWQIGATLGFVGGFFKSVQTNNSSS